MVDSQIHTAGIVNPALLKAFRDVPRETFIPPELQSVAYADGEIPLGGGRYLPESLTHAKMIQAAEPTRKDNVLDIGGGTGYPAAIMASLVANVVALEDKKFMEYAGQVWAHLGITNITPAEGPLFNGYAQKSPYDIITINGAVSEIPVTLIEQLAPGGRLLAVVKSQDSAVGRATLIKNSVGNKFSSRVLFEAGGHYLPGFEPQPVFVFKG